MTQSNAAKSRLLTALRLLPATMLLAGALSFTPVVSADALDTDGDGLFDQDEISVYFTNPQLADTDGDGTSDGEEVYFGTDPLIANAAATRADSDGDGLYDDDEQQIYGTDPANPDTDGDGVSDGTEVYGGTDPRAAAAANPPAPGPAPAPADEAAFTPDTAVFIPGAIGAADLVDADGDGLSDGDETRYGTDPTRVDSDNDGLRDGEEVHTFGTNPLVWDTDGNGFSDWEDLARGSSASTGGAPAPATGNAPEPNEPVEPMAPDVSDEEREKILNGGDVCEIDGACGNGTNPDLPCFQDESGDADRINPVC